MLPPVSIKPLNFLFQVQHYPVRANLAFACSIET